jgi:hypothetical protein
MDKTVITSGKRHSFFSLFKEYDFTIEIPTIQRDYAQGRKSKKEVRDSFLLALHNYLNENLPNRDLDFVYGTIELDTDEKKFIPLDGQQRLTTLFLLHWYLSIISGPKNLKLFKDLLFVNKKSRFTYLTRPSSTDFLNALMSANFGDDEFDKSSPTAVSDVIKNQGWFFLSWMYDSTIQSMLNMLDDIHIRFNGNKDYYTRLTDEKNPIITFLFLDLKKFKLTEDLYIKMNARGKPLTPFENFKANFEKHIGELFGSTNKPFHLKGKQVTYKEYVSFQIDTSWANLLWNYRELVGKPNTYDEELMNYLGTLIVIQYASNSVCDYEVLKKLINYLTTYAEENDKISFYRYDSLKALDKNLVEYFIASLDILKDGNNKIKNYLSDTFYYDENAIFEKALKGRLSAPERVLFHAYLKYLINNTGNSKGLHQWIRVIHNLVINSRFDDDYQFYNAIQSINKLIDNSDDIIECITDPAHSIDFFDLQKDEEILKAHLIKKSNKWTALIEEAEKSIFHNGQIGYLLEFSGILQYIIDNSNLNWSNIENDKFYNSFKKYLELSVSFFSLTESNTNKDYVLERSLLTKGDYLIPASSQRRNFSSSKNVSNYVRDFSWKRLLRIVNDDPSINWKEKRNFVKQTLDDKRFDKTNVIDSLEEIIIDGASDWRNYFIRNFELIKYCSQGFIGYYSHLENEIELYGASQLNHYHIDMYVYNFYLTYIKNNIAKYGPFTEHCPSLVKTSYDNSCAYLYNWIHIDKYYEIGLYRNKTEFNMKFKCSNFNLIEKDFEKAIKDIMLKNNFEYNSANFSYDKAVTNENEMDNELTNLCAKFKNLIK